LVLVVISVIGNIGIDLSNKKITFGFSKNKRSCGDCVNLLLAKRTTFETLYYNKQNSILRQQMIFAEHKLLEMELILQKELHNNVIKEIRRSMIENNFSHMKKEEYDRYICNRKEILINYISPNENLNIKILEIIEDIYFNAKNVKLKTDKELDYLVKNFNHEIEKFIL
jgi:hypothetical protein